MEEKAYWENKKILGMANIIFIYLPPIFNCQSSLSKFSFEFDSWLNYKSEFCSGGKEDYSPGDTVQLNCSSFNSKPAADINWFINQEPANLTNVVRHPGLYKLIY